MSKTISRSPEEIQEKVGRLELLRDWLRSSPGPSDLPSHLAGCWAAELGELLDLFRRASRTKSAYNPDGPT